jgi:hypothetical protein
VIDALRYHFPDQADKLLHRDLVKSDEDYIAIENFCVRELGVNYDGMPRPEFLTIMSPLVPDLLMND